MASSDDEHIAVVQLEAALQAPPTQASTRKSIGGRRERLPAARALEREHEVRTGCIGVAISAIATALAAIVPHASASTMTR
jgi:hypothetical protein